MEIKSHCGMEQQADAVSERHQQYVLAAGRVARLGGCGASVADLLILSSTSSKLVRDEE